VFEIFRTSCSSEKAAEMNGGQNKLHQQQETALHCGYDRQMLERIQNKLEAKGVEFKTFVLSTFSLPIKFLLQKTTTSF
jgi:hypothetical protein